MQPLTNEFLKIIADRLKVGSMKKPACIVEVDRYAFIPGSAEELKFTDYESTTRTVSEKWLDGDYTYVTGTSPVYFPIEGKSLSDPNIVTSEYGWRYHPIKKRNSLHTGIDLAGTTSDKVVAVWPGTVASAKNSGDYGLMVKLDHADGTQTWYAHLSRISVRVGASVTAGTELGYIGTTGASTGPHLHFEVRVDGKSTNPKPYLNSTSFMDFTDIGAPAGSGVIQGTPGNIVLNEKFDLSSWFNKSVFEVGDTFKSISSTAVSSSYSSSHSFLRCVFKAPLQTGFKIKLQMRRKGFIDLWFASNFNTADGDTFSLDIDGNSINVDTFKGLDVDQPMKGIMVPAGDVIITFKLNCTGNCPKEFRFNSIKVQELNADNQLSDTGQLYLKDELFTQEETVDIPTGRFVYMDTLLLDNVINCDVVVDYEQEASTATLTLTNLNGYYSPDYNPFNFPELYQTSPWSYFINGFQVGVLSDNTPIRIFMGYGDNSIRVFTGLIDKINTTAEGATLTIQCRDMYKKIINKVLTETKRYGHTSFSSGVSIVSSVDLSSPRSQELVSSAMKKASEFGIDYRFLLAISKQETGLGTLGMGRVEEGSYVLGYGCYSSGPDSRYKGVDTQMYYGAKRVYDVFGTASITSWQDVETFRTGGSTGLQWTPDINWTNNVWNFYQAICGGESTASVASSNEGTMWVLSAAVHDLVAHAGLIGWRGNEVDMNYPDIVIEETYLIEPNQRTGKVLKAVPDQEGVFIEEPIEATPTVYGWMNPFVIQDTVFEGFQHTASDCITELLKDTQLWSHCDRYGTYRLEEVDLKRPVVAEFYSNENIITLSKSVDFSRARSHCVIIDGEGQKDNFIDKEILLELKGEVRTAVLNIPWARSYTHRRKIAERFFFDIKRICRTLQVVVPGNPALDILDRVRVVDRNTATSAVYIIKSIRHSFSKEAGYIQTLNLMWSGGGEVVI